MSLQEKGYGKDKGIPTLIIAAASCDDVLAVSAFGVVLGMAFSTGKSQSSSPDLPLTSPPPYAFVTKNKGNT